LAASYMSSFSTESKEERESRYDTYQSVWLELESQIKEVQDSLNESIINDLLRFVREARVCNDQTRVVTEIPTGALVTGVNVPDHGIFFSSFVNLLKENVTPYVAQLQSKACSNLKFLMRSALDALVNRPQDEDDDDADESGLDDGTVSDEDRDGHKPKKRKQSSSNFVRYTFTELRAWYCASHGNNSDLNNLSTEEEDEALIAEQTRVTKTSNLNWSLQPPIVFIFEDFERFPPAVLQDFILICSEYTTDLPIVLLFGVNTAVTSVHRLLPHLVSSKLSIQTFQSQPSIVCLRKIIDQVIITDRNPFKLGPRVFRLLYEHFLYHDFSINNFVRGLKFCVMDHINSHPSSVMCTKDEDEIRNYLLSLNGKYLDNIRGLPSFRSFIEKKSENEQKKLQGDEELVLKHAINHIKKLQKHEEVFFPVVKCLYICASKLPKYPLGKWLRDTYEYCTVTANITKEQRFDNAMSLLRILSREELLSVLEKCITVLTVEVVTRRDANPLRSEAAVIQELAEKFPDLDKVVDEVVDLNEEKKGGKKSIPAFKSRYEFTEQMKMAVKEKKKETPYEKLRASVVDYLETMFKKHLENPLTMPCHEIFYYDDVQTVKSRLNGTPRVAIQKALSDPKSYLHCSCCSSDTEEISSSMPDVCILYKLHLESGRLINLYDWLQAFMSYIDPALTDGKKKKSEKKRKAEEQIQARFIRGISELQFLGFIKGTRRKTDHVSRLTWGSC